MKVQISLFLFVLFSSLLSQTLANDSLKDIDFWCSTTPHPEPCRIFTSGYQIPKKRSNFRTFLVQVVLEQALQAQAKAKELEKHCHTKQKKAAWIDCTKLFDDTILNLNRTHNCLKNKTKTCTDFDAQTWLSTALTNLETCKLLSHELKVSSFISTMLSHNVSELISITLYMGKSMLKAPILRGLRGFDVRNVSLVSKKPELISKTMAVNDGYPNWITKEERKLLQSKSLSSKANYVVAQYGSGDFRSIQEAINYAVSKRVGNERIVIHVKKGVYRENIEISGTMSKITLVGDGLRYTIITGSRSVATGFTTYSSATVGVDGPGFMAQGITFRNTAGPQRGQAVALRSASDLSAFYACSFEGYQDTLFVLAQRQFYKSCYIYGTIDFIFGNAAVVLQNCIIYVRKPMRGQANVITAQGRADPFQNTGISIHNSRILAASDLAPMATAYRTYLGRPWQQFSRTVYLKCYLGSLVSPAGWLAWENSSFAQTTLFYGEYMNFGPGASLGKRVNWKGYHVIENASVASQFTVSSLIAGRSWLPGTGVPYIAGL